MMHEGRDKAGLAIGIALVLALTAPTAYGSALGVKLSGYLREDPWLAIRFNVTPDNDLVLDGVVRTRSGEDWRTGGAVYRIIDGVPAFSAFGPGGASAFQSLVVSAGGSETTVLGRCPPVGVQCSGGDGRVWDLGYGGGSWQINESFSRLAIMRASYGWWWLNATWTRGVLSWDVASGTSILERFSELGPGPSVETEGFFASTAAAAFTSRSLHTHRDTVGWFLPEHDATGQTAVWSCQENSHDCASYEGGWFGALEIVSKGPTQWQFDVDAMVVADGPSILLGVAELPDDDYLA